jgi:signal transduction histidine kinase
VTRLPRLRAILGLLVVGSLGLTYGLTALVIARRFGTATTYAGSSVFAAWCFVSAGLALVAAGLVRFRGRPRVGALSIFAGLIWFAPIWEGWEGGPALVRTIGMLAASFVFPVLVHLVLAAAGQPMSRAATAFVGSTYTLIGLPAVIVVLIRDPYLDPYCWANCTTNVFDATSQPDLARQVGQLQSWITAAAAVTFAITCIGGLTKAFRAGPRRYWEVLPGGGLLGAATVAHTVLLRRRPLEDPSDAGYAAVFVIGSGAVALIAVGLAWPLSYARRQRRLVARIVATLDQAPPVGTLDSALAQAVGDPNLRIAYWLPAVGHYTDAHGRQVPDPTADTSVTTTPLVRDGQTVAVIAHHTDPAELERGLGSAVRLALDNERLQADVRARMHDLDQSRMRIVEAADLRRQSLEHDLHDGAQQSLLGLSYDLRLARSTVEAAGDAQLTALFDSAIDDVREAFSELRELAHGIFPAVLTAAGLCPSITSLTDTAHLPVDVDCTLDQRYPVAVETASYMVAARGIDAATRCGAHRAAVLVARRDAGLVVEVTHDGRDVFPAMIDVADRVGAARGRFVVQGHRISAEIPCES